MTSLTHKLRHPRKTGLLAWLRSNRFGTLRLKGPKSVYYRKIVIRYQDNPGDALSALCDKHGADKGSLRSGGHSYPWPPHTYADYYSLLFSHRRDSIRNVFECGVGRTEYTEPGASLRVWRDYFPNADIFAADINKDVLFEAERIKTYYVDQTSPASIKGLWDEVGDVSFDIIVDDGLHTFEAGVCFFENAVDKLAENGIFVIEDVTPECFVQFQHYFADKKYFVQYVNLYRADKLQKSNNLLVIWK